MRKIVPSVLLLTALFGSRALPAGVPRICVGNFTGDEIAWTMTRAGTRQIVASTDRHERGETWRCEHFEQPGEYAVQVFDADGKYAGNRCYLTLKTGEWVEVTPGAESSGNAVTCTVGSETRKTEDASYGKYGRDGGVLVRGEARYVKPLAGATVRVLDASGRLLKEKRGATGPEGTFSISLPEAPGAFLLEVTDGSHDGAAFREKLSVFLVDFDFDGALAYVNAPSTMAVELMRKRQELSIQAAEARVQRYLAIPESIGLGDDLANPYQTFFDERAFARQAVQRGGLDVFLRDLVDEIDRDENASRSFLKRRLGVTPAEWAAEKAAGGIIAGLAGMGLDELMRGIGVVKPEQQALLNALAVMDAKLNEILAQGYKLEKLIQTEGVSRKADAIEKAVQALRTKKNKVDWWRKEVVAGRVKSQADKDNMQSDIRLFKKRVKEDSADVMDQILNALTKQGVGVIPITVMWADLTLPRLIGKSYIEGLWKQIEYYRTEEVYILGLWKGVHDDDKEEGSSRYAVQTYQRNKAAEKPMFGNDPVLQRVVSNEATRKAVDDGKYLVDRTTRRIWYASLLPAAATYIIADQQKSVPGLKIASGDQVRELFTAIRETSGVSTPTTSVLRSVGFPQDHIDKARMVLFCCTYVTSHKYPRMKPVKTRRLRWFGMDQSPWQEYDDPKSQWDNVYAAKRMDGVYFFRQMDLN